jgi:hypothetical protein
MLRSYFYNFPSIRRILALCLALTTSAALAQVHVEIGNAGDLPGTAQTISDQPLLSSISGTLTAGDRDMYLIRIGGLVPFSATVTSPASSLNGDPQLFLFDSAGFGVLANDDNQVLLAPSRVSGILPAGDYYLAITEFNDDPVSNGGLIFPDDDFLNVIGPTGPGGGLPIIGWTNQGGAGFAYTIAIENATGIPSTGNGVPSPDESSSLILLSLGMITLAAIGRRLRR